MRILHLIDGSSPQASPTTLALLNESLGRLGRIEERVLLLGGGVLRRAAHAAGIRDAKVHGVPFGHALAGWVGARAAARELGVFDMIHCWSLGAFSLASLAWRSAPRLLTVTTQPSKRGVHWLRVLTAPGSESGERFVMLPISSTLRRDLLAGGVAEPRVHVLRPGLDMAKVAPDRRAALRESWGIAPARTSDDRVKVIALLSDPAHAADTDAAHMAVGLADETYLDAGGRGSNPELRLLVHPAQLNRARGEKIAREIDKPARIIQEPRLARPWEVLPGCDAALAIGPHAGGLSLLWAMVGNVPIVGDATYAVSEIVEDRHSALLVKPGNAKLLAHRLNQIMADKQLAWKLRDTARHEAFSYFSRQRYCQSLVGVYEQLAGGREISIPELPITGGLRFAGRA